MIRELISDGIVTEAGSAGSDGGQPRVLLRMNPDYGYVIGVDVGETVETLRETSAYLGAGIGGLINLFGPERVILGGWAGLLLGERLLPAIREAARQHSLTHRSARTTIELGQLGPDAVALGAATLPMERFLSGTLSNPVAAQGHRAGGLSADRASAQRRDSVTKRL